MSNKNKTRTQLSDVLTLYTTKGENPLSFTYEVECTTMKAVNITLNFKGSENFSVNGNKKNDMKLNANIRPFTRKELGTITLVNEDKRASLKMGCEWIMEEPNEKETSDYIKVHDFQMSKLIKEAEKLGFPRQLDDPTNQKVIDIAASYGKSFIDLDFPPLDKSLYKKSTIQQQGEKSQNAIHHKAIEWKRPTEFMGEDYHLFFEGIHPDDIRQGALGDCWFLCAIAALTEFPQLVEDLFPEFSKESNPAGVYTVRFCKNGIWQNVRVDDYFPCYPGGGPIYSRSNGNELWVLLLEKAFAKMCGSYESIKSGWAYEAMMDLTGAPTRSIHLDDPDTKVLIDNGSLWAEIKHCDDENFIMSASTPGEDTFTETGQRPGKDSTGLVAGHAYTLISAKMTSKGDKLVKLRNPWGSMEWNGDWSDSSPLWTEEMQAEIEPLVKADDGTFWMCFEDLLKHFYSINICMVRHPSLNKTPWKEARRRFHYDFDGDESLPIDKRITCPSYLLTTQKTGKFVFSVHQNDIRIEGSKPYIDIGVTILKPSSPYGTFTLIKGTGNTVERQNQTEEFDLPPGKYLVVPTTTGCKLNEYIQNYHQSHVVKERVPLTKVNDNGEIEFTDVVYKVYTELFNRMDVDSDGYLNKAEMDQYMLRTEGAVLQDPAYHWLLHNFETRESPGLTLAGFIRAQLFVFKHTGADEEKLRKEFKILGYEDDLSNETGRTAALSIHSTVDFVLQAQGFDENALKEAIELPVIEQGNCTSLEEGKIQLYKFKSGYHGLSFLVKNNHHSPLVFDLDCTQSTNVSSHRGNLKCQETIPGGESRLMHHLFPTVENESWKWSYSASYMWDE